MDSARETRSRTAPLGVLVVHERQQGKSQGQRHRQEAGRAIRQAYALASRVGATPIAQEARALARRTRLSLDQPAADAGAARPAPEDPLARVGLTEREREILVLLAGGRSNPQIAETLCLADDSVKKYVSRILAATGCQSRMELALLARSRG